MGIVSIGQALTQLPAHQQPACSEKNNNNSQRSFQDTGNNQEKKTVSKLPKERNKDQIHLPTENH